MSDIFLGMTHQLTVLCYSPAENNCSPCHARACVFARQLSSYMRATRHAGASLVQDVRFTHLEGSGNMVEALCGGHQLRMCNFQA